MFWKTVFLTVLLVPAQIFSTFICSRYPANTITKQTPVDENFVLSIGGNPETYVLGQEYEISVNAFNGLKYITFILALENDNGERRYDQDLGEFQITDTVETRYMPNCINMVESTNTNPKSRSVVSWVAPKEPGSGCILIRATLMQHRDVWYMDDGGLTKRICEEDSDDVESQTINLEKEPCCACDEARYELIFEGMWSRNIHPKDFPAKGWITRFAHIIGASHTENYRFWESGGMASEAMQEYVEHGSSALLEQELTMNFKLNNVRTMVKARGPAFPNMNGQSVASIRVDPMHHLLSLASKIDPSPDWFVGVSGLELCMTNCTWLEQKIINLYPWDAGTDAGPSYISADQPQKPPDVIRRMRSDFPNDPRSPFYDENGLAMKPLAILTIRKQRTYERMCKDEESNNVGVQRECLTHPWPAWSECSSKCGMGMQFRNRVFKQPDIAKMYNCDSDKNYEEQQCQGGQCGEVPNVNAGWSDKFSSSGRGVGGLGEDNRAQACELSEWTDLSPCNATCGEGFMMRSRKYMNPRMEHYCQNMNRERLFDTQRCTGDCMGETSYDNRGGGGGGYRAPNDNDAYRGNEFERNQNTYKYQDNRGRGTLYNQPGEVGGGVMPNEYYNNENEENIVYDREQLPNRNNDFNGNEASNEAYGNIDESVKSFEVQDLRKVNENIFEPRRFSERQQYRRMPASRRNKESWNQPLHSYDQRNTHQQQQYYNPIMTENLHEDLFQMPSTINEVDNIPQYCFEQLIIRPCLNTTTVGNFWFYNFCEDDCMLYSADVCDRNTNKFASLEICMGICSKLQYREYLKEKQLQSCSKRPKKIGGGQRKRKQRLN